MWDLKLKVCDVNLGCRVLESGFVVPPTGESTFAKAFRRRHVIGQPLGL